MIDRPPSRIESFRNGPVGISGREYLDAFNGFLYSTDVDPDAPMPYVLTVEKRDRFVRKQRMPKRFRK